MKVTDVLKHPDELVPLLQFYVKMKRAPSAVKGADERWAFCYDHLGKVSRSFYLVIMELEPEVREAVCVFYLVLRALDTVEDDTSVDAETRKLACIDFYNHLGEEGWTVSGYGKDHEKNLLEKYYIVVECYNGLHERYRTVIKDICKRMGEGMALHISHKECFTTEDYDKYCYYVAGLVGLGLSKLFYETGRESKAFVEREDLSISMGLFLQKVNIIRDFLEDLHDNRTFWPREIWTKYVDELGDLAKPENEAKALQCLNRMIGNALEQAPDSIEYMRRIQDPHVFKFCAIPQVMALGTMVELYGNPHVYKGVVKLRRGATAKMVLAATDFPHLMQLYYSSCVKLLAKMGNDRGAEADLVRSKLHGIMDICLPYIPTMPDLTILNRAAVVLFAVLVAYLIRRHNEGDGVFVTWRGGVPDVREMVAVAALFIVMTYLFSFFGLQFVKTDRAAA